MKKLPTKTAEILLKKVFEISEESARLIKASRLLQEEQRKQLHRLEENDKDLARVFKKLGIENPHDQD